MWGKGIYVDASDGTQYDVSACDRPFVNYFIFKKSFES